MTTSSSRIRTVLNKLWFVYTSTSGKHNLPVENLDDSLPAYIPSTVGSLAVEHELPVSNLEDFDYWYHNDFEGEGKAVLNFEGLATIAEVWLNGVKLFTSDSMFLQYSAEVQLLRSNRLDICFRSLTEEFKKKLPRARWRQQLVDQPALRGVRTTLLGHMPGWCPAIHVIGPYRAITCTLVSNTPQLLSKHIEVTPRHFHGDPDLFDMVIEAQIVSNTLPTSVVLQFNNQNYYNSTVEDQSAALTDISEFGYKLSFRITVTDEHIARWYPHTNGNQISYPVEVIIDDKDTIRLGNVGFKQARRESETILINGSSTFCRGAVWSPINVVLLSDNRSDYYNALVKAKNAGMNMLRVSGTMIYEGSAFYDICDELGIMVWQDFMFANFDYPRTSEFYNLVELEVTTFLKRTQHNACITVLCGGSEVYQQAAMLGLTEEKRKHELFSWFLKDLARKYRPDAIYIENSPSGDYLPFNTRRGITHYFGVPAYLRPLSDIRRSNVKFAAECLALSNVPCDQTVQKLGVPAVHSPAWKAGVSRDNAASWDFEDVRDYYLQTLFEVEPNKLRRQDQTKYLELSRAVSHTLIKEVFSEWRSKSSDCAGGLVLQLHDATVGAGWGLIDSFGIPKAAYYAFKQVNQRVQVVITDEGLNGLDITVINETMIPIKAVLSIVCLKDGLYTTSHGRAEFILVERTNQIFNSSELFGTFVDICYAYKFGPPSHDVVIVKLEDNDKNLLSQAVYYPGQRLLDKNEVKLTAVLEQRGVKWLLTVSANRFAQLVHVNCQGYYGEDDWVDIAPGCDWVVELLPNFANEAAPVGYVSAINAKPAGITLRENK